MVTVAKSNCSIVRVNFQVPDLGNLKIGNLNLKGSFGPEVDILDWNLNAASHAGYVVLASQRLRAHHSCPECPLQ